jgi:hypothetical protein
VEEEDAHKVQVPPAPMLKLRHKHDSLRFQHGNTAISFPSCCSADSRPTIGSGSGTYTSRAGGHAGEQLRPPRQSDQHLAEGLLIAHLLRTLLPRVVDKRRRSHGRTTDWIGEVPSYGDSSLPRPRHHPQHIHNCKDPGWFSCGHWALAMESSVSLHVSIKRPLRWSAEDTEGPMSPFQRMSVAYVDAAESPTGCLPRVSACPKPHLDLAGRLEYRPINATTIARRRKS